MNFTTNPLNGKIEYLQNTQRLFSVCMHEIIRQTSVHCVERGQLLAKIWIRYVDLLNVLIMLFRIENDQHMQKEHALRQDLETMNMNYLQAINALEETVLENIRRSRESSKKMAELYGEIRDLQEDLDSATTQLRSCMEELRDKSLLLEKLESGELQQQLLELKSQVERQQVCGGERDR